MSEKRLGNYILERKLATGGMAEIWLGRKGGPAGFSKQVVLKKILPHLAEDSKFVEMFIDEARLAAQLEHPNIVQIFDLGESDGDYFIAMEFIDGWDLEAIVQRVHAIGRTVPPALAARILADACTALDYAHAFRTTDGQPAHLVHRDISPQNILVSRTGVVKVVDFGVAKAATSSHKTQTGAVKGKLSYMSPEQITAKPLDGRSDIFALGIVLYELLTGVRPFGHDSELLAVTAILHEQPRQPTELRNEIPFELENIILRALQKDPRDRFQTAGEMHVALEQALRSRGEILTNRDVAAYLEDLFSANPTGHLSFHQSAIGVSGAYLPGGHTLEHVSATPTTLVQPGGIRPDSSVGAAPPQPTPSRMGPVLAVVAAALVVAIGAVGAVIWFVVMKPATPTEGDAADTVAATADSDATGAAATAIVQPDVAPSPADVADDAGAALNDGAASTVADTVALDDTASAAVAVDPGKPTEGSVALADPDAQIAGVDAPQGTPTEGSLAAATPELAEQADAGPSQEQQQAEPAEAAERPAADAGTTERRDSSSSSSSSSRGPGTLRITLTTGGRATVYVDGDSLGSFAGARSFEVPAGSRSIRVVHANGQEQTRTVEIRSGQSQSLALSF